jgi:hypothetical protein
MQTSTILQVHSNIHNDFATKLLNPLTQNGYKMKWRKRIGERKLLGEESWSCHADTRGDVTTSLFETLGFGKFFLKKVWKEGLHKARATFWWFLATKKNMLVPTLSWHCPDSLKTTCCFAHLGFLTPKKKIGSNPFLNVDQILWKQLVVLLIWHVDYETFKILYNYSPRKGCGCITCCTFGVQTLQSFSSTGNTNITERKMETDLFLCRRTMLGRPPVGRLHLGNLAVKL